MEENLRRTPIVAAMMANRLQTATRAADRPVVCAFLFFMVRAVLVWWRGRAALCANRAEMLARHDFVSPTINGEAWLEKPVLY